MSRDLPSKPEPAETQVAPPAFATVVVGADPPAPDAEDAFAGASVQHVRIGRIDGDRVGRIGRQASC